MIREPVGDQRGSSSCKAAAFALEGQMLAEQSYPYSPEIPRPLRGRRCRAERFWSAFSIVTHGLARAVSQDTIDVLAIKFTWRNVCSG